MLGWVAATNRFGIEPGVLFMVQFFWQFPHFWAIGWLLDDDYQKAGFKMLPTGKRDKGTAVQILMYTFWTLIVSLIPALGITGDLSLSIPGAVVIFLLGLGFLWFSLKLFRERSTKAARILVLASVLYISLLQIVYVLDKWIT
jgi:protoheme IX farnesyltransferase